MNQSMKMAVCAIAIALGTSAAAAAQSVNAAPPAVSQATTPASPTQGPLTVESWVKRSEMLGDWGGARTRMGERGLKVGASWTQFFQDTPLQPPYGNRRDWNYGGKLDFKGNYDFSNLKGFEGLSATTHLEFRYGDTTLLAGGTLLPTNTALLFPENEGNAFRVSSLYVSKLFGTSSLMQAGRFNTIDLYDKPFTGGEGLDKFQNLSFVAPALLMRTTPPVVEGLFFTTLRNGEPLVTVGVYESTDEGFFDNGGTVYGAVRLPIKWFEAPGHYTITGTVSSIEATSLDQSPYAFLPLPGVEPELVKVKGAYTIDATFDQYLWWDPATKTGYGLFGSFGFSDANPTPFDMFGTIGVGGTSPIPNRTADNFGVGYYFGGVSNTFRESVAHVVPLRNESGFEGFYNVAVTGWSKVAADIQVVDPFAVGSKTRWLFAVRWKLIF